MTHLYNLYYVRKTFLSALFSDTVYVGPTPLCILVHSSPILLVTWSDEWIVAEFCECGMVKGKVVHVLNQALHREDVWESGIIELPVFISALDGGVWSASPSGCFTDGEKAPDTHLIGGWMNPGAGLDIVECRKTSWTCRKSNHRSPARSHTEWAISAP
jgi:hypothetical protein